MPTSIANTNAPKKTWIKTLSRNTKVILTSNDVPAAYRPSCEFQSAERVLPLKKVQVESLREVLRHVPAYDTAAPVDITSASLDALSTQLDGINKMVAGKEQALAAVRTPRNAAYDQDLPDAPCLKTRMRDAKEATKSQYGSTSGQYAQVKGIKV